MRVLESNSCLMIIVGFNLFRNSFSMISRVLKCFMEFYRNFIAYGITHSMSERRRMSGRRTFSAGQRPLAQPSFLYLLPRASEMKQILCFDWLCEKYWLLQGIKPPRLKIYLRHQSLGRRERVSGKQSLSIWLSTASARTAICYSVNTALASTSSPGLFP